MNPGWVLALSLLGAPQVSVSDGARVDADAVTRGLQARLGEGADPWSLTIDPTEAGVRIRARAPGRGIVDQEVELAPDASQEERSIIVTSSAAFALEQAPVEEEQPPDAPDAEEEEIDPAVFIPPWWLAAQGHLGLGLGPVDPSGGLAPDAGRWLGPGKHLRLSLSLGWAHTRDEPLRVHAFQPTLQLDAGKALCERTWMGAGLGVGATGTWAFDQASASGWALRVHVPAIIEVVLVEPLFFRGTAGLDLQTPALRFKGAEKALRWGVLRPFLGLGFGLRLG